MSKVTPTTKAIEIDLGDGDVTFVNWDNVVDISLVYYPEVPEHPNAFTGLSVPLQSAYVGIEKTSINNDITFHKSALDIDEIKQSIRAQLDLLERVMVKYGQIDGNWEVLHVQEEDENG